jgi:hypothetical protein
MSEVERRIWICGKDTDFWYLQTRSWSKSNPKIIYDLTINLGTGETTCSCLDSQCRRHRRNGNILDPTQTCCKHQMKVVIAAQPEEE